MRPALSAVEGRAALLLALGACAQASGPPGVDSTDASVPADAAGDTPFVAHALWTERLGPLVGTARSPFAPAGLIGTDLGVSFPVGDQLVFLFGDSWTIDGNEWDVDSVATTALAYPADGELPALTWMTRPGGRFLPLQVPGVALGGMNVPVDGFVVGDRTYVFFTTGYSADTGRHTHSVLAHTDGTAFGTMVLDHVAPSDRFLNLQVVIDGDDAYLFGSGPYRASAVYLARAPLATIADRSTWTYWQGGDTFGAGEASAAVLVEESHVGELSVRYHAGLGVWLMAYNSPGAPARGIHLRTASAPTGPWSDATVIWQPEDGYQYYMHVPTSVAGFDDGLGEPGREEDWGGEYGPYLVPEWFDGPGTPAGTHSIVYALSSWNPYTVHLIRTVLGDPSSGATPSNPGAGLPPLAVANGDFATGTLAGWSASGDPFGTFVGGDGDHRMTTYSEEKGDDAIGRLWQDVVVDGETDELRFRVHGGRSHVRLLHDGDVVRSTHGRNTNDPDLAVRWKLRDYRGDTVRIEVVDDETGEWGFVGATGFLGY